METLFSKEKIANRVKELGEQISHDYEGKRPVLVCILKGAVVFTTDLMRSLSIPAEVEFMQASSYKGTQSTKKVTLTKDLEIDVRDRHLLIIDTIIDTGHTLKKIIDLLQERKPASLKVVTLLDKKVKREVDISVAYNGFVIDDVFVVGYGLDYGQDCRCLPQIDKLK